jgi:hypothetical protein
MKHRVAIALAVVTVALAATGSAFAFDCMRVSSSMEGLQQSTAHSGNWLYFDMTPAGTGVADIFADFFEIQLTPSQLSCFQNAYSASSAPKYFALGIGVAGGHSGHGTGVLAHNAPDKVLMNGTGIEHFDDTVVPVFEAAAPTCLGL